MPKTITCRCEDITEREVRDAIAHGYADVESLKRYLGVATGPCQGKGCLRRICEILIAETGAEPDELRPIAARPPVAPVALKLFAAGKKPR